MAKAYIGTSGFLYKDWFGTFYPEKLAKDKLLVFYQKQFKTVEINSSFYHIPRSSTVKKWNENVSNKFVFSFKAPRIITHLKKLHVDKETINMLFNPLQTFYDKPNKHIVFFQTPAFLKANLKNLENLLSLLPKTFLYAFEFRHQTWFNQEVYNVLKLYNTALVLSDSPINPNEERMWPYADITTANFSYIRFHGSQKLYASSYNDGELNYYAQLIKDKLKNKISVFAYFNNDINGYAVENAKRLKELLEAIS